MEFGKHIDKELWRFEDKSLMMIYGLGFIFMVIRFSPAIENVSFVLIRVIFTRLTALRASFTLQSYIYYAIASEEKGDVLIVCSPYFCGYMGYKRKKEVIYLRILAIDPVPN